MPTLSYPTSSVLHNDRITDHGTTTSTTRTDMDTEVEPEDWGPVVVDFSPIHHAMEKYFQDALDIEDLQRMYARPRI